MGQSLEEEQAKLIQLQQELDEAIKENNSAKERDYHREDGSPRQDLMHEEWMQKHADREWKAQQAVDKQTQIVKALLEQGSPNSPGSKVL